MINYLKKTKEVKPDLTQKSGKYFKARQKGLSKTEAALKAGFDPRNTPQIEDTQNYKACVKKYADVLRDKIDLNEIADEQIKNILQDTDKGAKNVAIKQALDKIEPPEKEEFSSGEVTIVIRPKNEV